MLNRRILMAAKGEPINIDNYLTFHIQDSGAMISLSKITATQSSNNNLEYCVDGMTPWRSFSGGDTIGPFNATQTISFRGHAVPVIGIGTFSVDKLFSCSGNINSLIGGDDPDNVVLKASVFFGLFKDCTNLFSTTNLIMPSTTLSNECYSEMFKGCTRMFDHPELPATNLARGCYEYMFENCSNLQYVPELPATTLQQNCYRGMFKGCEDITESPILPASTLVSSCYSYMFSGCTNLNKVTGSWSTNIATTVSGAYVYTNDWLSGVASSGTIYCPVNLNLYPSLKNNPSGIPTGWTCVVS